MQSTPTIYQKEGLFTQRLVDFKISLQQNPYPDRPQRAAFASSNEETFLLNLNLYLKLQLNQAAAMACFLPYSKPVKALMYLSTINDNNNNKRAIFSEPLLPGLPHLPLERRSQQ